jgi:hypothetical protein
MNIFSIIYETNIKTRLQVNRCKFIICRDPSDKGVSDFRNIDPAVVERITSKSDKICINIKAFRSRAV